MKMPDRLNKYLRRAQKTLRDNKRLKGLLGEAGQKLETISKDDSKMGSLVNYVQIFVRMIQNHFSGKYKGFSWQSLLLITAGIIYFVTPIDLLPDFIPALGFTDDLSVLYFIYKSLISDIEAYKDWEQAIDA